MELRLWLNLKEKGKKRTLQWMMINLWTLDLPSRSTTLFLFLEYLFNMMPWLGS